MVNVHGHKPRATEAEGFEPSTPGKGMAVFKTAVLTVRPRFQLEQPTGRHAMMARGLLYLAILG